MNENNNRVTRAIDSANFMTITDWLLQIEKIFEPHTVGITPEEHMVLPKVNVDNKVFIEDCFIEMKVPTSKNFMPVFLDPLDLEIDLKMFNQCEELVSRLSAILTKVDNTRILAGSEAYSSALTFKKLADAAEAAGVPGADQTARKLRERFMGQGATQKPEEKKTGDKAPEA